MVLINVKGELQNLPCGIRTSVALQHRVRQNDLFKKYHVKENKDTRLVLYRMCRSGLEFCACVLDYGCTITKGNTCLFR